jgi:hypothetical protein
MTGATTAAILGLSELAKMALAFWFAYQRQSGKSEEEIDAIYQKEKAKAHGENAPGSLPDPPAPPTGDGQ